MLAGGTAISVVGTGFGAGMSCNIGTVSAITSTSCTVTTFNETTYSLWSATTQANWTLTCAGTPIGAANPQTFTFLGPSPTITSVSGTGTSGGSGTIGGTNFQNGGTASVNINGTPTAINITFNSSTNLTYVLPAGSYTAGTWTITYTNPSPDLQQATSNTFVISSVQTPATIFGSDLKLDAALDNATLDGSNNATALNDASGNSNSLPAVVKAATALSTVGQQGNGHRYMTMDGSTTYYQKSGFTLGAGSIIYFIVIGVPTAHGGGFRFAAHYDWGDIGVGVATGGQAGVSCSAVVASDAPAGVLDNVGSIFIGGSTGVAGPTNNCRLSWNNDPVTTESVNATIPATNNKCTVGCRSISGTQSGFFTGRIYHVLAVAREPTSADMAAVCLWANTVYNIAAPPVFTRATDILASTAWNFRISGSGFVPGIVAKTGGTTLTISSTASTLLEITGFPSSAAGSYPLTLTNPDGQEVTYNNVLNVTAALNPMTIGANGDALAVKGWWEDESTNSSGTASVWFDKSLKGNSWGLGTAPTWNATDAEINNLPSIQSDGSTQFMTASLTLGTSPALWMVFVIKQTNTTGTQFAFQGPQDQFLNYPGGTNAPKVGLGGSTKAWTAGISGWKFVVVRVAAGANPTIGINVDNGTEQTAAGTGSAAASGTFTLFKRNTTFFTGKFALGVMFTSAPTSTDLANLLTYAGKFGSV